MPGYLALLLSKKKCTNSVIDNVEAVTITRYYS